jgi:hypothetical protein
MARTRLIKPGFFSNDLLAECDPLARLLFAGLWTIVDRDGRMVDRRARIKAQLLPYDDCNIDHLMGQLVARGFIEVYAVDGVPYLQVTGFAKHQRPHKKELSENLPEPTAPNALVTSPGFSVTSPGLSATSREDFGSRQPLTLLPSPFSLDPSPLTVNPSLPSVVSSDMRDAQSKRRRRPDDPLSWNVDEGWVGITDADRADWAEAFPAVDIDAKLKGLTLWLKAWPKKATKSRWRAWLLGRLRDEQDRGGSRAAGGGGGGFHRDKSHIPEDSHPDEEHLWFMTDGRTPRRIAIYKTKDGRLRYTSGEYAEDTTSQGDGNENDE